MAALDVLRGAATLAGVAALLHPGPEVVAAVIEPGTLDIDLVVIRFEPRLLAGPQHRRADANRQLGQAHVRLDVQLVAADIEPVQTRS